MDRQLDLIFAYDQQLVLVDKCMTPFSNVDLYHPPSLLTVGVINVIPDNNLEFKVEKLNFRKGNFEGIAYSLDNFTENNDKDEHEELFYYILFDIFKKNVPKSTIYESAKIPWSNKELRNLRNRRSSEFCKLFSNNEKEI